LDASVLTATPSVAASLRPMASAITPDAVGDV
jgi:hypothetical protein